jgi:hypothetical protein
MIGGKFRNCKTGKRIAENGTDTVIQALNKELYAHTNTSR